MDQNSSYYKQVQLLVQILPLVAEEDCCRESGLEKDVFLRSWQVY